MIFDFESALERFMGEKEILLEVLPPYIESLDNNLKELLLLDPKVDCTKIRQLAHSIKGSSLNLDIIPLGKEAEKLEDLAYNNNFDGIPKSLIKVQELAAQTKVELQKYL